jgi:hypothetical protein
MTSSLEFIARKTPNKPYIHKLENYQEKKCKKKKNSNSNVGT